MYPGTQTNNRKLQAQQQYKPQGSYSPKMTSSGNQTGKLLFAAHNQHQISQAAIATAGMQGFEESRKR